MNPPPPGESYVARRPPIRISIPAPEAIPGRLPRARGSAAIPPDLAGPSAPPPSHPASSGEGLLSWPIDRFASLGIPNDWSAVKLGLHPFAPQRVVILPSGAKLRNYLRCAGELREQIKERIDRGRAEIAFEPAPLSWEKREIIFRLLDRITEHYDRPDLYEDWAVELADRESLSSTALGGHVGVFHQFQMRGEVAVDCPPLNWWLVLIPGGIDWASPDGRPVHALIGHVAEVPWYAIEGKVMERALLLAGAIGRGVADWPTVGRMGRIEACRHLNAIAARLLSEPEF